eukprot:16439515-Heterocapsa_arctica.AAC.1
MKTLRNSRGLVRVDVRQDRLEIRAKWGHSMNSLEPSLIHTELTIENATRVFVAHANLTRPLLFALEITKASYLEQTTQGSLPLALTTQSLGTCPRC